VLESNVILYHGLIDN